MQITYRTRLSAISLGAVLAVSLLTLASPSAQADPSVPTARELAQERFQLPNPMSREYMQVLRSAPMRYEAPVDVQTPVQPRRPSETN